MNLRTLFKSTANSRGMMLPMVIAIISVGAGTIAYVTMNLLPKLQEEKKKAQNVIAYRIFVSSLNDYVVHGLREKWCLNKIAIDSKKVVDTDLLISTTECISGKKMHEVVTYDGNLERLLWKNEIGSSYNGTCADSNNVPPILQANTILYRNCYDHGTTASNPPPLITKEQIVPTFIDSDNVTQDGMKFRLPESVLQDMSDQHPLYLITKDVKKCIKDVEIELKNVKDISLGSEGDERKISIQIKANLYKTKLACLFLRDVKSSAYYTFYPRRLHTFTLLINKELDASIYNEFHGPVYVSGNLKIPETATNRNKSTIFYDTLTLGTFNDGNGVNGVFKAGRIVNDDNSDFTFEERGDPYLSKQDQYPTFRGLLGGLRLDAIEDKGFYNLFNASGTSSANVTLLEQCIDQNKVKTTPSVNNGSILAYQNLSPFTPGQASYKILMGINQKNRFKPSIMAPAIVSNPSYYDTNDQNATSPNPEYNFEVPPPANGTKSVGVLEIAQMKNGAPLTYSATMGGNSEVHFSINPAGFDVTIAKVQDFLNRLQTINKDNFNDVVDNTHILNGIESTTFKQKANALKNKCDNKVSNDCITILGYTTLDNACTNNGNACDYTTEINEYNSSKSTLANYLQNILTNLQPPIDAKIKFKLFDIENSSNQIIVNRKRMEIEQSSKWVFFTQNLRLPDLKASFKAFHYGNHVLDFKINFNFVSAAVLNTPQLIKRTMNGNNQIQEDPTPQSMSTSGNWKNLFDNTLLGSLPPPEELIDLDCPEGMGLADWDTDMSGSSQFAWIVANTNPGVDISAVDHTIEPYIYFAPEPSVLNSANLSGANAHGYNAQSSNQFSMAKQCLVSKKRKLIYGFYVCDQLIIEDGRTGPLTIIGTFIVNSLNGGTIPQGSNHYVNSPTPKPNLNHPVIWRTVWNPVSADLFFNHYNTKYDSNGVSSNSCSQLSNMNSISIIQQNKKSNLEACSAVNFIENGINNLRWTTVDPDIGLASPAATMTSQKVSRIHRWIIREDSRLDLVR